MTGFWGWEEKECEAPDGLIPCKFCGILCAEAAWVNDIDGRGQVIRIGTSCRDSLDLWNSGKVEKDDLRTEFSPESEAVAEWNEMMRQT